MYLESQFCCRMCQAQVRIIFVFPMEQSITENSESHVTQSGSRSVPSKNTQTHMLGTCNLTVTSPIAQLSTPPPPHVHSNNKHSGPRALLLQPMNAILNQRLDSNPIQLMQSTWTTLSTLFKAVLMADSLVYHTWTYCAVVPAGEGSSLLPLTAPTYNPVPKHTSCTQTSLCHSNITYVLVKIQDLIMRFIDDVYL